MADSVTTQLSPFLVELEEGRRYAWCRCGRSSRQPFCDGNSHKETDAEPFYFTAEVSGAVNLCGCKQTCDEPYCDGSHNFL
jgi:CDGSH iron-sulfur domain-containing protein 3